ncbi:MAG: energy transducer TonB, partial [Flavobacterium sp.]
KGTVVVDISIDKYGHVRKATPGARGTTTTSQYLLTKAMQAAESAQFDNVPTAPLEQTGYMIISF